MYHIVSEAGTVLAKGFLTAPDARRALSFGANRPAGWAHIAQTVWQHAHVETDDGLIRVDAPPLGGYRLPSTDPREIRLAKRRGNVQAVASFAVLGLSALLMVAFIWAAVVGATLLYGAIVGQ